MKFHSVVFVASQALYSSRALQILSDSNALRQGSAAGPDGPSDAEYNAIFRYIEQTEDSAKKQISTVCAFLDREGADVNKIVNTESILGDDESIIGHDTSNIVYALARSFSGPKSNEVLARALAGVADDALVDWRVIAKAVDTKVQVLDVLMKRYEVNLNILLCKPKTLLDLDKPKEYKEHVEEKIP